MPKKRLFKTLRTNILTGILVILPVAATIFVINFLFKFLPDWKLIQMITDQCIAYFPGYAKDINPALISKMVSFLTAMTALFCIGLFTRNIFGKKLYGIGDSILGKIPGISTIYIFIRNISTSILAQKKTAFQEVVIVEYPRKGLYSLAFVTAEVNTDFQKPLKEQHDAEELVYLFVPTTPNPTSGILIMSPHKDLTRIDISAADAMKLIISAGVSHPGEEQQGEVPALLEKIETWLDRETPAGEPSND